MKNSVSDKEAKIDVTSKESLNSHWLLFPQN